MTWESLEDAFKDLDSNEFAFFASALAAYRKSLMKNGFTRREAIRLVETYSKFIYDMSIEEFVAQQASDEEEEYESEEDEDIVDSDEEDDVE